MSSRDKVDSKQIKVVAEKPTTKSSNDAKSSVKSIASEAKKEEEKDLKKTKYESEDDEDDSDDDDESEEDTKAAQKGKDIKTTQPNKTDEIKTKVSKDSKDTNSTSKDVEKDDAKEKTKNTDTSKDVDDSDDDDTEEGDDDDDGDTDDDDDDDDDDSDDTQVPKSTKEKDANGMEDTDEETESEDEETGKEEEKAEEDVKKDDVVNRISYENDDENEDDDESGNETASSIPSLNEDDSRKGSDDDSLNSSQQPMLRLSAMSHISGMSDLLPVEEEGAETAKEENAEEKDAVGEKEEEGEENKVDENEDEEIKDEELKDDEIPQEVIESDRSFSPVDVSLSEFDDKDSDVFGERTVTERELSSRQAESPSDRAESALSHVTVKDKMLAIRGAYENDEGALTSEPEFNKTQNAKSREIMRKNKHRIWYEIPETSDEECGTKSAKTRKKTLEKRRTELRARSRKKRNSAGVARSANKSATRTRKTKPTRKRAQATSIVLIQRTEETFEECNSSGESIRPLESSMSIRIIEERYDDDEDDFSDARSSVDPDSESSGEGAGIRRKHTPDLVSEEEVKPKKRRKGKAKNNTKENAKENGKGNAKGKAGQTKAQQDKEEAMPDKEDKTAEVKPKKKKKKKQKDKEVQDANQEDNTVHEITIKDNEVHEMTKENEVLDDKPDGGNKMDNDELNEDEKRTSANEVDDHEQQDRGDSGISRSTRSSSPPTRHASSKWAYRTTNLHPGSETEDFARRSQMKKRPSLKLKQTPRKKKTKELPVVRGIPRVIRRVNTETMLMAGTLDQQGINLT